MSTRGRPELSKRRVTGYVVGEVWPRFISQYPGARTLEVYSVVEKLADYFLFPQDANSGQSAWYLGVFDHMPDEVSWLSNEFRKESNELMRLEISDDPKRKNQIGQLKFLVLLGVEEWSLIRKLSKSGSLELAAEVVLRMPERSLERRFEGAVRQVEKSEARHKKDFKELVNASVPQEKSLAAAYPDLAKKFPEDVAKLDLKLQESRDARVKDFVAESFSEMARRISDFVASISEVLETSPDEVKDD